jgi:polysaccharide export outer membrane protein
MNAVRMISCAGLALVATGCGSLPADPASCPEPEGPQSEYVIGPGDALDIVVWRNADVSLTVPVRPDGRISTPLVEDVVAAGLTPTALARQLETALSTFLRTPKVTVIVQSQGPANQVQAVGEFRAPGPTPYRENLRVMDVVVAAGGLNEFADGNAARIVRELDGRQVECRVRIADLMDGDLGQNLRVYSRDVLIVPESWL